MSMNRLVTTYVVQQDTCANFVAATCLDIDTHGRLTFTKTDLEYYIADMTNQSKFQAQELLSDMRLGNIEYVIIEASR